MSGLLEKLHLKHPAGQNTNTTGAGGVPTATVTGTDFNRNGIPDQLEGGRSGMVGRTPTATVSGTDLNRNGIPDQLEGGRTGMVGLTSTTTVTGTDLNRNGIPDQLEGGRIGMAGQTGLLVGQTTLQKDTTILNQAINTTNVTTVQQPIVHETTHVVAPIVQETVRQDRVVEVQPVVHREVDKNVVHHIEKHYTETAPSQAGMVNLAPVVQQQINTNVINEIQPIIHRERVVPVVERTEQHLTEHIVAPTIHTHEVVYEQGPFIGVQTGMATGVNIGMTTGMTTGMTSSWARYGQASYSGLNFPYTGAVAHPQYGYQRLPRDRKIERFELKAAEYERRGNMAKAQKNRQKAQQLRARMQPGYQAPVRPQNYYLDRANLYDQKARQYQQWGMVPQAQRYQGRSQRIRNKHNIPMTGLQGTR